MKASPLGPFCFLLLPSSQAQGPRTTLTFMNYFDGIEHDGEDGPPWYERKNLQEEHKFFESSLQKGVNPHPDYGYAHGMCDFRIPNACPFNFATISIYQYLNWFPDS